MLGKLDVAFIRALRRSVWKIFKYIKNDRLQFRIEQQNVK